MEKMNLGAQLYTLRAYTCTPKLFPRAVALVAEMGYKYIQFSGEGEGITPEMMLAEAKKNGLGIGLTHWDDEAIINDTLGVLELHDKFGCDGIGIGGMPRSMRYYEGYDKFVETYGRAIETIGKYGKHFCYHNHWFEFERYENGKTGMDMLLEKCPEGFYLTFDTAWAHHGGVDCAEFIRKHGDKIYATHLKDLTIVNDEVKPAEVLEGNMNFDGIIRESLNAGIKWHFVEQDESRRNVIYSLQMSHDNLMERYGDYLQ